MSSRKQRQEQLDFLESEYMRLSVSNNSLKHQNACLKDAIANIKKGDASKKPAASAPSAALNNALNTSLPATPTTIPLILNQQQLTAYPSMTRAMPQALQQFDASKFASRPELAVSLLSQGAPGGNIMGLSSVPFGSGQQNFSCCNEFIVFCALNPAAKEVFIGARHKPACRNYPK